MAQPQKASMVDIFKGLRSGVGLVLLVGFFINLLALVIPIYVLQVYDRVIFSNGISTLVGLTAGALLAITFDFLLKQARSKLVQRMALHVDVTVGKALYGKLASLPLRTLESRRASDWQSLFRDAEQFRDVVAGAPLLLLLDLPFALLFLLVIWIIATPVAWVVTLSASLFVLLAILAGRAMERATGAERNAATQRDAMVSEVIQRRLTAKSLDLGRRFQPRWEHLQAGLIEESMQRGNTTDRYSNLGGGLTMLTSVVMVSLGALAILDQQMTMGALIAANMLSGKVSGPMAQFSRTWRAISNFKATSQRLKEVLALKEDKLVSDLDFPTPKGSLEADKVSFAYGPGDSGALKEFSYRFSPGKLYGIVGPNGGGKTTLLKVLQGLYSPQEGTVKLDEADIQQFGRHDLAQWIGYVPQETDLFEATIKDNIAKLDERYSDEDILQAANDAGATDFIGKLPDGFGTKISEGGRSLSAGQRRRLATARAFVGQPPVLILDEPSTDLDRQGELHLAQQLTAKKADSLVIVVSHHMALLEVCDEILLLDDGRLRLAGPPHRVLSHLQGGGPAPQAPQQQQSRRMPRPPVPPKGVLQ